MCTIISPDTILITGLAVNISGTMVMTIPLISRVRVLFQFGKLKEAKRSIRYDRLETGDEGFEEVASRHLSDQDYEDQMDVNDVEYITHEPKLSADLVNTDDDDSPKYVGSSTTDLIFVKYSGNDASIGNSYRENIQDFYNLFEPDIQRGEEKFRLIGVTLLGVGFVLQIMSILM